MNHEIGNNNSVDKVRPINYVKGWAKSIYNILTNMAVDNMNVAGKLKDLVNEFGGIISQR